MASFSQSGAGSEPTFSYAEAAKGRRPAPKPPIGDQATESTASQSPSLNGTSETSITHQDSTPESRLDTAISKLENKDTAVKPILSVTTPALPEDISSKHKSETESPSSKHLSPQTAFSAAESPTDRLLEHQPNGGPETNGIESLNLGGDPVGHVNNDGNELVASWDAASTESQGKPPAAPAAAPLPVVNVWQKRREALYPKSTTNLPTKKGRLEDNTSHGKETLHDPMPDSGMSQTAGGFQKASGPSAKGEAGLLDTEFSTAIPAEQSSPTKKQHTNKPINGISNGIAGTATSWPTPDHATEESRRKMADRTDRSEKNDKEDEKDRQNPNKSKRKGWVALPFVPTVNFNTPLPSPRRIGKYNSRVNRDDTAAENGGKEQQGQEEYQLSAEDHGQGADGFARSSGQYKGRARFENNAKGMQQNQAIAKRTNILVSNPGGDGDNVRSSDRPLEAPHRVADQSSYQPRPSQTGYVPRRASSATQTDHDWRERNDSRLPLKTTNFADTSSGTQQSDLAVTQQRPPGSYRSRGPESVNSHDFAQFRREGTSEQNVFNHPQRDHRGDKIADRGRGNDRRRGGGDRIGRHPPLSANTMMNGTAPVDSSSYVTTTSPTKQPGGFASFSHPPRSSHPPANHRTNRGGAKTHSLPYPQITHPLSASPRVNSFYNASPRELDYQPHYEVPMYHPAQESLIYENQYPDVRLFSFLRDQM